MRPMRRCKIVRFRKALTVGLALTMMTMSACTTLAPSGEQITPFRQGVAATEQQVSGTLADVNSFLRRQQIELAIRRDELDADSFVSGLDAPDLASWRRTFGLIGAYAEKLERLLSPEQRAGVETELSQLGESFAQMDGKPLPAGVSAAFVQLGGLLVQVKAGDDALEQIRQVDPAIQRIFDAMGEAIGADTESGIRGTVADTWRTVLARIRVQEFLPASDASAKRAAVLRFVDAMDQRDAQDQMLDSLRLSLASLAAAHQQLAVGRPATASALIGIAQDEYRAYRDRAKAICTDCKNANGSQP